MPSYIYKHMQLLVEDKAVSAFLKYCTILQRCCIRLYLHNKFNEFLPIISPTRCVTNRTPDLVFSTSQTPSRLRSSILVPLLQEGYRVPGGSSQNNDLWIKRGCLVYVILAFCSLYFLMFLSKCSLFCEVRQNKKCLGRLYDTGPTLEVSLGVIIVLKCVYRILCNYSAYLLIKQVRAADYCNVANQFNHFYIDQSELRCVT